MSVSSQQRLGNLPLSRKEAERLADEAILSHIGSTPHISRGREVDDKFVFDVEVSYPRVIWDESGLEPRKTRFITVGKVGEIVVDRNKGRVTDRPGFYDVQRAIREKLDFVSQSVEKALLRVAADRFSTLPFPIHLHTPVLDVLSWLLVRDSMSLSELTSAPDESRQKLLATLDPLSKVGLIEVQGDTVIPGAVLVGIEERYARTPDQLSKALAHFFREGYLFLDTVRQVLGAHLTVSSVVYEKAEETGEVVPLTLGQIETEFRRFYSQERLTKLPRYLVQLESIGIAMRQHKAGVNLWSGVPDVFALLQQEQLLEPVGKLLA